jgi:hypothetical protein
MALSTSIERLSSIGGPPLGPALTARSSMPISAEPLRELLERRNGFHAFESALHFFPLGPAAPGVMTVQLWNEPSLWRAEYEGATDGLLFFAEDLFGEQFGLRDRGVVRFDPETATITDLAPSLEAWAELILQNFRDETGWPLAHEWQRRNGPIPPDHRLRPYPPLIAGGELAVEHLTAIPTVEALQFCAYLYRETKDLPDGTSIRLVVTD